jgi:hypothetical protein
MLILLCEINETVVWFIKERDQNSINDHECRDNSFSS